MVLDSSWNQTTISYGHRGVTPIHLTALLSGIVNWLVNAVIWIAFAKTRKLLSKSHLHLFYAFAVTNSLTGFFTIPTYVNLILHNNLNCPRWTIMIGSTFEIACDRIRSVITLAISVERIHALWRPEDYYFLDHKKVGIRVCMFAVAWGLFDAVFLTMEDSLTAVRVHCVTTASSGPLFHWYFLISAILFGLALSFMYFLLICRLFILKDKNVLINGKICRDTVSQANSLTVMVIMMVMIFSVLPSCLYLYDMIVGEVIFMRWGPIITIGHHLYGITSFFFYNYKHREIRAAINTFYPFSVMQWLPWNSSTNPIQMDVTPKKSSYKTVNFTSTELIKISDETMKDEIFL